VRVVLSASRFSGIRAPDRLEHAEAIYRNTLVSRR
jgi:hypothetical protein